MTLSEMAKMNALKELVAVLEDAWDGYDPDGLVEAAQDKLEEVPK